jgi:drug/metabolite transporter (DMT)-like permease
VIWTLQVKYGALAAIFWGQLFAFVYLLPISIPAISNSEFHWGAVVSLMEMGMFGTGIGYALYGVLVARAGPIRGAIGLFLTPIVATFNGIIFRNDSVRLFAFVGMAIVVVGAVLTSQPESTATE